MWSAFFTTSSKHAIKNLIHASTKNITQDNFVKASKSNTPTRSTSCSCLLKCLLPNLVICGSFLIVLQNLICLYLLKLLLFLCISFVHVWMPLLCQLILSRFYFFWTSSFL
ncbi:hypothetical protein KC19_VG211000 [Ceratodon purpureus]|uniref:Uncharacterized protein n=1 Tax=Ceratodon purpureus TaxID=3225 RepID=A0A8T0HST9_CERPU|nr:hypothetical protein KC19_VG211000 [Ceratodon purpureus]